MTIQEQVTKAKISARNVLLLTAFCVECTFLFLLLLVRSYFYAPLVFFVLLLLCAAVPLLAFRHWNTHIRRAPFRQVPVALPSLPYSPKVRMPGARLTLDEAQIHWHNKQQHQAREVAYSDIQTVDVQFHSAWLLKITRHSGKLSLSLNLSLLAKDDWPAVLGVIAAQAPHAALNDLAREIKNGRVPPL